MELIDIPLRWVGIATCLFVIVLASLAEASLSAISRRQLNGINGGSRAKVIDDLITDAYRFKVALLLLNTMALIALTALAFGLIATLPLWQQITWMVGATVAIILIAEALPKAVAIRNPAVIAKLIATPFSVCMVVLRPLIVAIDFVARSLLTPKGSQELAPVVTEEELMTIVNVGEEEGILEPTERAMIKDIITFGDTIVREIMTPRVDVITISTTASIDDALNLITGHGHSRIPVYRESSDRIIGVLYAKDLLASLRFGQKPAAIHTLMRHPFYVPELINIDDLLRTMQNKRVHFAVVVDEYGATTGIVTLEDILEEIVGDINDEFDIATLPDMVWNGPTELTVDARVLLDDINDQTGLSLSSETSDRIGGFIAEHLGRMSQIGDQVSLPDHTLLTVMAIDGIRTSRIRINIPVKSHQGGDDESNQSPTTH